MGLVNCRFKFLDGRDFVLPVFFNPTDNPSAILRYIGVNAEDFGDNITAAQDPKYAQRPRFEFKFLQMLGNFEQEPPTFNRDTTPVAMEIIEIVPLPKVDPPYEDYK